MSGTLGWPTVTLELNTTRDPNDPGGSDTWVPIKSYATEITTRRGRTDELADVQAGTMDLVLLNDAGRFDPANAGSLAAASTQTDSSSGGRNGTLVGSVLPTTTTSPWSGFGQALVFDGVQRGYANNQGVDCGTATALGLGGGSALTVDMKLRTGATLSAFMVAGGRYNATGNGYGLSLDTTGTHFDFFWFDVGNAFHQIVGSTTVTANTSYDVEASFDGTTMRLFVNGNLDASLATSGIIAAPAGIHFYIGRNDDNSPSTPWCGTIDEVRLSSVARHTAAFTPAAAPFASDGSTVGLWHLDDTTGVAGSPYYPNLRAWRQVRMLCSYSSTTYSTFRGYEETFWPQSWTEQGTKSWCKPTFVDAFAALAKIDLLDCVLMEMLADGPLALYPLSDSAGAPAAGNISGTKQPNATVGLGAGTTTAGGGPTAIATITSTAAFGAAGTVPASQSTSLSLTTVGAGTTFTPWSYKGPTLTLPAGAALTSGGGTWNVCLTLVPLPANGFLQFIYQANSAATEGIIVQATTTGLTFAITSAGSGQVSTTSTTRVDTGTPHEVEATLSADGKTLTVYVDGVSQGTAVVGSALTQANFVAPIFGYVNYGAGSSGGHIDTPSSMSLANVATYSSPLSGTRIAAHYSASSTAFAGEVPSGHITRLLSYAAWLTALENIDTTSVGDSNSPQVGLVDIGGKNLLQALKDISNGVLADLDVDGSGKVRYRSRDARLVQTTPAYTFGENTAGGELPYTDLPETGAKPDYLYSQVQVDQVNGITALRGDATANLRYFPTTLQKTTYLQDPEMVLDLADDLLRRYKDPHERAASFVLDPASNPSLWPAVLGMDYGTRIRVMRRPANGAVKQIDCYVESISHHINFTQGVWQTTVTTSAAPPFFPWILGDATYGVLGVSTIPVF